ncbi:hypothetical protein QBC35DRAFT_555996 [Podospora australis]|uniref:Uncharacterized protein n=1 Tax=Podospora australis TaxID=1536484 RepID=A0AAN6WSJ9_9PEZI|nr:hypothetical protein QBC35DRAFT_555996 [Podospora australis]
MKFSAVAILALFAGANAVEMKACAKKDMSGTCTAKTSNGKSTGTWNSYNFRASSGKCVRICKDCDSLGFRCQDYSNSNISFNKFIIFSWANGDGPDATTCC